MISSPRKKTKSTTNISAPTTSFAISPSLCFVPCNSKTPSTPLSFSLLQKPISLLFLFCPSPLSAERLLLRHTTQFSVVFAGLRVSNRDSAFSAQSGFRLKKCFLFFFIKKRKICSQNLHISKKSSTFAPDFKIS